VRVAVRGKLMLRGKAAGRMLALGEVRGWLARGVTVLVRVAGVSA